MVQSLRPRLTAAQKTELWRRWRRGESLNAIGRALGRIAHVVRYEVARTGGIPQRRASGPVSRSRWRTGRSSPAAWPAGTSVRQISRQLRRAPSTVSREVRRHGGRRWYRAARADAAAWARGRRPKRCRLATYPALRDAVATKLAHKWSPQQIAGWLRQAYPDDPTMHVSHETIYRSLFVQSRGVLKKALQAQLRQRRTMRRPRAAAPKTGGYIVGAVSIRERPATVEDRAVPGHWEGDLIAGSRQSYVATLVERRSRYVCLVRVAGRTTRTVVQALTRHVRRLPDGLMATLTWDRGLELAAHRTFSIATGVQVYFCDPYSPWQRGTNENTNGLLRQYLPKGTDPRPYTQAQLNRIAREPQTRATQDTRLSDTSRYTRGHCCTDRLNASDKAGGILTTSEARPALRGESRDYGNLSDCSDLGCVSVFAGSRLRVRLCSRGDAGHKGPERPGVHSSVSGHGRHHPRTISRYSCWSGSVQLWRW